MTEAHDTLPQMPADRLRQQIRDHYLADETQLVTEMIRNAGISDDQRHDISDLAAQLISEVRESGRPSMMESFLAEYGLTTREGVALMCLAEALLRVPDAQTIDELIEDKISHRNWGKHLGHSGSSLVNASTWALLLTGNVIQPDEESGLRQTLQGLIKRLGEPLIRTAVAQAMRELGRNFVLSTNIDGAIKRAAELEASGHTYSYDMLGEAARTEDDARHYHLAYSTAIGALAEQVSSADIRENPGISVKLSALHPRYELGQHRRVMEELVPRAASLAMLAHSANMGFNIDAEEADRLDLSLDVIEALLSNPALAGWDGFGVVVQAFGKRSLPVLDWLYALAEKYDRKIMVRLVKGAYWDTEIKRAQVLGLDGYPVFTRKLNTDISYIVCARRLMGMTDRIYPQFATHNAHSVATVLNLAGDRRDFEFQRLHGMGQALHQYVHATYNCRCRVYAPVGEHRDLLAYLVRRLLENGANSSFVNQIVDASITAESIARDPISAVGELNTIGNPNIAAPVDLYGERRLNSQGWDITDLARLQAVDRERSDYRSHRWVAQPMIAGAFEQGAEHEVLNPANPRDLVGVVYAADAKTVDEAVGSALKAFGQWSETTASSRADCLRRVADLYETNAPELFALLAREAGKNWLDAVGEVREAVDFARYYAEQLESANEDAEARGVMVCISPWNFPLAIFSGQILAVLAAGNCVIAKPAEQTSLIAARAVQLMHDAGIPLAAMQLLPGSGSEVGAALSSDSRVSGVCFTGSTATAKHIDRNMATHLPPDAPLVAETGGLNAMIVDATALPEQVVRDVLASAFQSAGQRCSALRMLYLQEDVADRILSMLFGAMDELQLGDPWLLATDVGPVIDQPALQRIRTHCDAMAAEGRQSKVLPVPTSGTFAPPTVIELDGIEQLEEEIFGPVLHVARFAASELDDVVDAINQKGYGLTLGMHTRVDSRVERVVSRIEVGNVYINRNQIGAVVGTQPFGGEGLSGTGPKAGGPSYLKRFFRSSIDYEVQDAGNSADSEQLRSLLTMPDALTVVEAAALDTFVHAQGLESYLDRVRPLQDMPGPTGEINQLSTHPRGRILCLGPSRESARRQAVMALAQGNTVAIVASGGNRTASQFSDAGLPVAGIDGCLSAEALMSVPGFDAVVSQADRETLREYRIALSAREGRLIPLICEENAAERLVLERHLCIDTTAAGGNASLIAAEE